MLNRLGTLSASAAAVLLYTATPSHAQVGQNCTVSVLNRTVTQNADGSWVLPNVPANFGPVRARVTCLVNGQTISGESDPFTVPPNGVVNIPPIKFGQTTPIPTRLTITAPATTLTTVGQTSQLVVTARYSDNTTRDVTASGAFTQYTVSNPAIATVTGDGLVRAVTSGTVLIQATHEGATGLISIRVAMAGADSDGDGLSDEYELAHGLNPNNPLDAQEDPDRDGLTNLQESQYGTDPRNADTDGDGLKDGDEVNRYGTEPLLRDTDGDGISDGLEVQTGSDPTDEGSYNLAGALTKLTVAPPAFTMTFNTIAGDVSTALKVTGTLRDDTTLDVTSKTGINYASSNLNFCNFGGTKGRVFAGQTGSCVITVTAGTLTATSAGTVHTFSPIPLSSIGLGSGGTGVDVRENFAYAVVGTGLKVVDVTNRSAPVIAASLGLPGTANDVKLAGPRAYVAAGSAGLHVVDISDPHVPRLVGSVFLPGSANRVRVRGNLAYVAAGSAGLQIVDVTTPTAPRVIGSVATTGPADGVDVNDTLAVVAVDSAGIQIVSVTNPASPVIVGGVDTPGQALNVVVKGTVAYVADYTGSLRVVDFTNPAAPVLGATTPPVNGGYLLNVAIMDTFVFGADIFFVNGVPIIDVSAPTNPIPRVILSFPGDSTGRGIAADGSYVYLVGDDGRLYIGQYRIQEDLNGIPPVVSIATPADGATFVENEAIPVTALASDDLAVVGVTLTVDGTAVGTNTAAPYQFTVTAPLGKSAITLGALAIDLGSNIGTATTVQVNVIPDPLTTVAGRVLSQSGAPVGGALVTCLSGSTTTSADGTFVVAGVPTLEKTIACLAQFTTPGGTRQGATSTRVPAQRGGTTNVGDIGLVPAPVVASVTPNVFDARVAPKSLQITGVNLAATTYSFLPAPGTAPPTAGTPQINNAGTLAVVPITVGPTAHGTFVVVAGGPNGSSSDPQPSTSNTITVVNAQDEVDADGDGFPDGLELLFGSNPFDSTSVPDPRAHNALLSAAFATTNSFAVNSIGPEPDSDGDGFPDAFEVLFGSDPADASSVPDFRGRGTLLSAAVGTTNSFAVNSIGPEADSDGDGFPDAFEVLFGSDPADASSVPDFKSRGTLLSAAFAATNSFAVNSIGSEPDSDGDGFPDAFEVLFGSDPADASSVPDFRGRGTLLSAAFGTTNSFAANTNGPEPDSDADGFPDALEALFGSNPFDASSVPDLRVSGLLLSAAFSTTNTSSPSTQQAQVFMLSAPSSGETNPLLEEIRGLFVTLDQPLDGDQLIEGETTTIRASVSGSEPVTVRFAVNGQVLATDSTVPYEALFTAPAGVSALTFVATAIDADGNEAASTTVEVSVQPDPLTTVTGRVVDASGAPIQGAVVDVLSPGLQAEFFKFAQPLANLPDLTGRTPDRVTRVTAINMRNPLGIFGSDPLGSRLAPDYVVRLTGWIRISTQGSYRFVLGAHEGARLRIGGVTVVDLSTGTGSYQEGTGAINLSPGLVPIEVIHFEGAGNAELQLRFTPPSGETQVVPPDLFVPGSQPFVATTNASGEFTIRGVPTVLSSIQIRATAVSNGQNVSGSSASVTPLSTDNVDVGDVVVPIQQR